MFWSSNKRMADLELRRRQLLDEMNALIRSGVPSDSDELQALSRSLEEITSDLMIQMNRKYLPS